MHPVVKGEDLMAFARADRIADGREAIGAMSVTVALSAPTAERAAIL
jgi:hypothetical protein